MPLKHAILGLVNYKSMTGYDIDRYMNTSVAFFWHAQTSQIYKELNSLLKNGWVKQDIVYQQDKPNKKVFTITREGEVELKRWLGDSNLEEIMKYKNPLLIKVFFSSNIGADQLMRLLEKYIVSCEEVINHMQADLKDIPEYEAKVNRGEESFYWGMTMTYGFMYYQNEIKWANWCIDKLRKQIAQ